MSSSATLALGYGGDGGRRRRIWRWVFAAVLVVGVYLIWNYGRTVRDRVRFLYWQRQCMRYVSGPDTRLWIEGKQAVATIPRNDPEYAFWPDSGLTEYPPTAAFRPRCLQRIAADLPPFLDDYTPIIFLHERISPKGTRRLIVARFGPNVDHAQLCSIWAWPIIPATLTHSASVRTQPCVGWFPGWWKIGVRKDKLRFAEVDPTDASHFIFRYEHGVLPPLYEGQTKGSPDYDDYHANDGKTFIVDGWLRDDGSVDMQLRE